MSKRLCSIHGIWERSEKQTRCPKCRKINNKIYDNRSRDKDAKKVYDSKQWREHTRPAVLVRDNYTCVMCGQRGKSEDLVVDHIEEIKDGGSKFNKNNLQTLCKRCHAIKTEQERVKRNSGENKSKKGGDNGIRFL